MDSIRLLKIFDRIMDEVYERAKVRQSLISIKLTPEATEKDEVNLVALDISNFDVGELVMHLLSDTVYASNQYAKMDYIQKFEMIRVNDDELQIYISRMFMDRW